MPFGAWIPFQSSAPDGREKGGYTSQKVMGLMIFRKHIMQLSGLTAERYKASYPPPPLIHQMATMLHE